MFELLSIISGIFTGAKLIKEKTAPVAPKGTRFDWDAYWKDVENGMDCMTQLRKRERGEYMTTKPAPPKWYELPYDTVVDVDRYQHDQEYYGKYVAEIWRKTGEYRQVKKFEDMRKK